MLYDKIKRVINMYLCDSHIHSAYSFDGDVPVEEMVKQGIEKNIKVMTITDHCDALAIGEKDNEFGVILEEAIPNSVKEVRRVAEIYRDKIKVLAGVELGEPTHFPDKTQTALNLADFDFILASTHEVRGREDFYFLEFSQNNIDTLLWEYFNEQLEVVKWNGFDSLAHFDYPARYIAERTNIKLDYNKFDNIIDEILKILIKNNKALEVNTSTISKPLSRPMASEEVLRRYKSLGGKLITLGSDAHTVDNLGKDLHKGIDILKKVGFDSYYYYEHHQDVEVKL
jgi:histidinol-phosphatase (PHP family)